MADGSWDNGGAPPKKGMPLWGKIALGCGVAMLLALGSCVALVTYGVRKGGEAMNQAWAQMRKDVARLSTDEGAREMYKSNPGLGDRYPTEQAFVEASSVWRGKLNQLPERPPSLQDLMQGKGDIQIQSSFQDGKKRSFIRVRLQDGSHLVMESDDRGLRDVRVD